MTGLELNPGHLAHHEDREGEHAGFTCRASEQKIFIVTAALPDRERPCPNCGRCPGHFQSHRESGGTVWLEWE